MFPFSSNVPLTFDDEPHAIQYVNALPGAGKTHQFVHKIAVPHVRQNHNSLLVYASPTDRLANEVFKSLIDAGIPRERIRHVTAKGMGRVSEQFREYVVGSRRDGITALPDGHIILCSHECIASLPQDMRGRERCVLVYDEARACLQDDSGYTLTIPQSIYDLLFKPQQWTAAGTDKPSKLALVAKDSVVQHGDSEASAEIAIWRWTHKGVEIPSIERLEELIEPTTQRTKHVQKISEFLTRIRDSSIDVYVHLEMLKGRQEYRVFNVHSPNRMFEKFARTLILSAYFESSQMYAFLQPRHQIGRTEKTTLENITHQYLDPKRMRRLIRRMRNAYLTYIFDTPNPITKTAISRGLVMSEMTADEIKHANDGWKVAFTRTPDYYRTVYNSYLTRNDRAANSADRKREDAYAWLAEIFDAHQIRGTPVEYMARRARELQKAFYREHGIEPEKLPMTVNAAYQSNKLSQPEDIWTTERLERFGCTKVPTIAHGLNAWANYQSFAFLATMKYTPSESRFLDAVIGGDGYDPRVDRTLDNALQSLWRSNVRRITKKPVLLIVTDRALAEKLQARFEGVAREYLGENYAEVIDPYGLEDERREVLPILHPNLLKRDEPVTILCYEQDDKESQRKRDARRKNTAAGKSAAEVKAAFLKTEPGKRRNSLTARKSQMKARGEDTSGVEAELAALPTLAQWKATPEGRATVAALMKPQAESKGTTITKCVGVMNHADFWPADRGYRLKLIAAAERVGLKPEQITNYPGGLGDLKKNWRENVFKGNKPAAYILARAKESSITW
ncbi:hypothetical protein KPB05_27100 [Burkholderia gladioli]|uniref:hypothetical protein n=1 Tax=Burkholderia gladioli TaxID=28095 RepID=UPI002857EB4D|nr:hypothetical protein [Burkholderia gladioli]MDR8091115.1 hypothetical protein [Burkholderia gladioli]